MRKRKSVKWFTTLLLGMLLIVSGTFLNDNLIAKAETYTANNESVVISSTKTIVEISDSKLKDRLRTLLGKTEKENLYSTDFITNSKYQEIITTDSLSGVTTITAENYQLDLSNSGITDIRELVKFEFPSTLKGINLAGNSITNDKMKNIIDLVSASTSSKITIDNEEYTPLSDFSTIIKKVNLNDNNLDLYNLQNGYLQNEKIIYGIQNFGTIHSSGLVRKGEINSTYYIRENDANYLSFVLIFEFCTDEDSLVKFKYDTSSQLLDFSKYDRQNGKISITVASPENTNSAYFAGYEFNKEFYLFEISIDEGFTVERGEPLNLLIDENYKITANSPLIVDGFGDSLLIKYNTAETTKATASGYDNNVMVTLEYLGRVRQVPVEFEVVDTIAPVIVLKGGDYIYSSQNRRFTDPGYDAYDPTIKNMTSGKSIKERVVVSGTVQIAILGKYELVYSVSDDVGNRTTVTRIVEIQESVLDSINVRATTSELIVGEDITLIVEPISGVDLSKYSNIQYYWYVNGNRHKVTQGDIYGKSVVTMNLTNLGVNEIYVRCTATQTVDNVNVEVFSDTLQLYIEPQLRNNNTVIIAIAIIIILILFIITLKAIKNIKNNKGNSSRKNKGDQKGNDKNKNDSTRPQIQVIKDYKESDFKSSNLSLDNDNKLNNNVSQNNSNSSTNNPFESLENSINNSNKNNSNNPPKNDGGLW